MIQSVSAVSYVHYITVSETITSCLFARKNGLHQPQFSDLWSLTGKTRRRPGASQMIHVGYHGKESPATVRESRLCEYLFLGLFLYSRSRSVCLLELGSYTGKILLQGFVNNGNQRTAKWGHRRPHRTKISVSSFSPKWQINASETVLPTK